MTISRAQKYKSVNRDGIIAIIIHNKKILLLKRRNVPIILNPGIWSFLSGGRDGKEKYIETAYREIKEESSLVPKQLRLLAKTTVLLKDDKRRVLWSNRAFIFHSTTDKVKLDFENSSYRWATLSDIVSERNYTNVFINKAPILNKIKGFLNEPKRATREGKKSLQRS